MKPTSCFSVDTKVDKKENVFLGLKILLGKQSKKNIYFNPAHVHVAICTCGGICPGLNNVIRSVVRCFGIGMA